MKFSLRILDTPEEMETVENLQRIVWPNSETDIVPAHLLLTAVHNGGVLIGAYPVENDEDEVAPEQEMVFRETDFKESSRGQPFTPLAGFVFGFPGLDTSSDGPRLKHCSHMLGVHPEHRDEGIGFALKRAQWQMVRHQRIDRITWTFDPLLSRNAHLNITRLGAVCNTYLRNAYGSMRDGMNTGLASDRFQMDWWVNSQRVVRRLSRQPRLQLDLAHFLAAEAEIINPTHPRPDGWPQPSTTPATSVFQKRDSWIADRPAEEAGEESEPLLLLEIPSDFPGLKAADFELAQEWRQHTRELFEDLFTRGYLVTDFIYLPGSSPRSFYVLSFGESTLMAKVRYED